MHRYLGPAPAWSHAIPVNQSITNNKEQSGEKVSIYGDICATHSINLSCFSSERGFLRIWDARHTLPGTPSPPTTSTNFNYTCKNVTRRARWTNKQTNKSEIVSPSSCVNKISKAIALCNFKFKFRRVQPYRVCSLTRDAKWCNRLVFISPLCICFCISLCLFYLSL